MATQKQIEYVLENLQGIHSATFFKNLSKKNAGIHAVLCMLYESSGDITAGDISDYMNVSTARVAALLKKMSAKGLIIKDIDINDARIKIIRLSPLGIEIVSKMKADLYSQIGTVIDKLGMEKMMDFISISNEIKSVFSPPEIDL